MNIEWQPFLLSFKLSIATTCVLFFVSLPIAYFLSKSKSAWKIWLETILTLPLVLPPTVIGFYLLLFLSPRNGFGLWLESVFHVRLVFNFSGLVIASCVYSLPFMLLPLKNGLSQIPASLIEASESLGKGKMKTLFSVQLPNMVPLVVNALAITFAHTLGEFGVVLMIGGNIPGETRLASIAIFDSVEMLDYQSASVYSFVMIGISILLVFMVNAWNRNLNPGQSR
jgi:molybdate transport system permease protein